MNAEHIQFHTVELAGGRPFVLKNCVQLPELKIKYETWGKLSPSGDNAILLCHALTGNAHAAGWWDGIVGEGKAIDTDRHFVVCSNVLGGCDGSTGPLSAKPFPTDAFPTAKRGSPMNFFKSRRKLASSKKPRNKKGSIKYGSDFPTVTIRDMVRAQELLTNHLGVKSWKSVIGGSMGGMQALEWAIMFPDRVRSIAPLCSTLAATPWQIAFSYVGRNIVKNSSSQDSSLAMARALAMISYRSDLLFEDRFARDLVDPDRFYDLWDKFQVENYLEYQGKSLVSRFDSDSYLVLNKAMDLHDVGRNRGGIEKAADRIKVPTLAMSVDSDLLYPARLQEQMAGLIRAGGTHCRYEKIQSSYGHDGFLLETEQVGELLKSFLDEVRDSDNALS